jgi:hypothetical protein
MREPDQVDAMRLNLIDVKLQFAGIPSLRFRQPDRESRSAAPRHLRVDGEGPRQGRGDAGDSLFSKQIRAGHGLVWLHIEAADPLRRESLAANPQSHKLARLQLQRKAICGAG